LGLTVQVDFSFIRQRQLGKTAAAGGLEIDLSLAVSDCTSPETAAEIAEASVVLYFLRHGTERELEMGHFEREVFCGVIRGGRASAVENLQFLLQSVYAPIISSQTASEASALKANDAGKIGLPQQLKKAGGCIV
jgi:hypothetical protein